MMKALANFLSSVKPATFGSMVNVWASEMKMPSRQTTISVKNAGPIYMLNSSSTLHLRQLYCAH
jgi:hypothetical protein